MLYLDNHLNFLSINPIIKLWLYRLIAMNKPIFQRLTGKQSAGLHQLGPSLKEPFSVMIFQDKLTQKFPQAIKAIKLLGNSSIKNNHYSRHCSSKSDNNHVPAPHYERNRKLLAKIFMIWSLALILLLCNVLGIL